ncbi:apolipoprotein N-acyltransferase [Candidatus Bipolaricaulota bacterium]|nr:apolipoprotein N-acyltransferase [Candidatus Bipolaricaulota bacterium]
MTHLTWKETLLSLGSGVLTALAMPGFGAYPLVFFSLVPLFVVLDRRTGFLPGFLFGVAFFAIDLRWIATLSRFYPIVIAGLALLALLFGLGCGILGMAITWRRQSSTWTWLLLAPALFVLAEYLRTFGPLSLGFCTLYGALFRVPMLIQSASLFGPWFISGVLVAINGSLTLFFRKRHLRFVLLAGGLVLLLATFSLIRQSSPGNPLSVAIVSSKVSQEDKLDGRNLPDLRDRYLELGQQALQAHADLIVFPESILPAYILQNESLKHSFSELARQANAQVLLGTGVFRNREVYNTVALFSESGELADSYDMVHPVPFGEYIPGRGLLERLGLGSWAQSFLPIDLSRGDGYRPVSIYGTPICFESTFPSPARQFTLKGAQTLITVTNDAWFDESSELVAHFASAVFRAVENRRWVIQAANGGISGIVSPSGDIVQSLRTEGVLSGNIELRTDLSLYTRWGNWIVLCSSLLLTTCTLIWRLCHPKESGGKINDLAPKCKSEI